MYVLEQTGSASVFAGLLAMALLPTILLSPFGGILADRANRRNIMVALDTLFRPIRIGCLHCHAFRPRYSYNRDSVGNSLDTGSF